MVCFFFFFSFAAPRDGNSVPRAGKSPVSFLERAGSFTSIAPVRRAGQSGSERVRAGQSESERVGAGQSGSERVGAGQSVTCSAPGAFPRASGFPAAGDKRRRNTAHIRPKQTSFDDIPLLVSFSKSAQALFCVAVAESPHAELIVSRENGTEGRVSGFVYRETLLYFTERGKQER